MVEDGNNGVTTSLASVVASVNHGSSRRRSSLGRDSVSRKLKLNGDMSSEQICDILNQAKEFPQYHTLTFDEVRFDANVCSAVIDLLKHTVLSPSPLSYSHGNSSNSGGGGNHNRDGIWQQINIEFCEGPTQYIQMMIQSIFVLDCVRHLFVASDDKSAVNDWFVGPFETSFRVTTNIQSLWLLVPVSEQLAKSIGYCLSCNSCGLEKLSLSGSTWDTYAPYSLMYGKTTSMSQATDAASKEEKSSTAIVVAKDDLDGLHQSAGSLCRPDFSISSATDLLFELVARANNNDKEEGGGVDGSNNDQDL